MTNKRPVCRTGRGGVILLGALFLLALAAHQMRADNPQLLIAVQVADKNLQPSTLKALLKERLATARDYAKQVTLRVKNDLQTPEEMMDATRMVFEAELDLCVSNKERISVLEKFLAEAKENERWAMKMSSAGQGRESTALKAKMERLQVEIALQRARGNTPADGVPGQDLVPEQVALAEKQIAIKRAAVNVSEARKRRAMSIVASRKSLVDETRASESISVMQLKRFEELAKMKTIQEHLVDESRGHLLAAKARRVTAEANIAEAESQVAVEQARVELAQRQLEEAELRLRQLPSHRPMH